MAVRIMGGALSNVLHVYASICIIMRMADLKERRQRAIADLIRANSVASQEELAERFGFPRLRGDPGHDLARPGSDRRAEGPPQRSAQLRACRRSRSGPSPRLAAVFRDWVRSVEPALNLVVIKTPPGSAHLVGVVLDQSELPEIAGTICGDDTIFIACRSEAEADALGAKLSGELQ